MSDDLVDFLRARLDEDEQTARQATEGPWLAEFSGETGNCVIPADAQSTREWVATTQLYAAAFDAGHIARHDPARVLAEVDAKRRIVAVHCIVYRSIGWLEEGEEESSEIPVCALCVPRHAHYQRREDVPEGPCLTLGLLALPYADHASYREDWRP
ncbi:DUF6221 family protein [Streptomyces chryseus]